MVLFVYGTGGQQVALAVRSVTVIVLNMRKKTQPTLVYHLVIIIHGGIHCIFCKYANACVEVLMCKGLPRCAFFLKPPGIILRNNEFFMNITFLTNEMPIIIFLSTTSIPL